MKKVELTALEAKAEAQKIAFSPVLFQVINVLLRFGILEEISRHTQGVSIPELQRITGTSEYGLKVLLEMASCADIVSCENGNYAITKIAHFLLHDRMSRVNFNFVQDVCYKALFHLDEAIAKGKPVGLAELGPWPTIYEGLSILPEQAKKSWFEFDHFYSDDSFPIALDIVFKKNPKKIVDIGGNTGKWAIKCCERSEQVKVTILDLPVQLSVAQENIRKAKKEHQISLQAVDVLNADFDVPEADVIWLSQFLDCFSPEQIVAILDNLVRKMAQGTSIFIMETFWDNQRFPAASYSIAATSVYFTAVANGNSKMYGFTEMCDLVGQAGLVIRQVYEGVGISHTILQCGVTCDN